MERLYEKILKTNADVKARFCMPGHSGAGTGEGLYACARFDWTEVCGLDNLLSSGGAIAESERAIAESMGYAYALMLTHGCTCAMHIAVNVAKDEGKTLLAVGDMHESFFAAARLYGADVAVARDIEAAENYCAHGDKIGGVFVTSPDYFGKCKDLARLRKVADRLCAYLVVDEAHGAHFAYSPLLPDNAKSYADISLTSMHKTLSVYGGGALVCVNDLGLKLKCEGYRALIHSSSPNYLTMASMDYADVYMRKHGERDYARVKKKIEDFRAQLTVGKALDSDDFTRLVVKVEGKDAYAASLALAERGIYAEMAKDDLLVFIVTPFNCDRLDLLAAELGALTFEDLAAQEAIADGVSSNGSDCLRRLTGEGKYDVEYVAIDDCLGRVCAGDIGVYPPGAPLIMRGERIDEKYFNLIKKYRNQLFGLASGRVAVIK